MIKSPKLVVISILCFWACSGHSAPPVAETSAPPTVSLTLLPTVRGDTLFITGSTDLPNGALIAYEIRHEGAATRTDVPIKKLFQEGNATVTNGGYAATVSVNGWPRGKIEVWAAFQTVLGTDARQPAEVISRFGELGEKLQGNNVTKAGSMKLAVWMYPTIHSIRGSMSLRATTPNWIVKKPWA
jgi:hypothetical protein